MAAPRTYEERRSHALKLLKAPEADAWVATASADGVTHKARPTADTDRVLFDARLAVAGIKYRFLQAKGLEFGEQMRDFLTRMNKIATRANNRVIDLDLDWGRNI